MRFLACCRYLTRCIPTRFHTGSHKIKISIHLLLACFIWPPRVTGDVQRLMQRIANTHRNSLMVIYILRHTFVGRRMVHMHAIPIGCISPRRAFYSLPMWGHGQRHFAVAWLGI